MGDFNSETGSAPYKAILAPGAGLIALQDTQDISRTPHFGPDGTVTGFKNEQLAGSPIDHLFVTDGVAVLRHAKITKQTGGRPPSEHSPVLAALRSAWRRVGHECGSPCRCRWEQNTAYELAIRYGSSDVCSSDLARRAPG